MPKYIYECSSCQKEQEIKHSIDSSPGLCMYCSSDNLVRIYKRFDYKINNIISNEVNPGNVINKFIKEIREDLSEYKKDLNEKRK